MEYYAEKWEGYYWHIGSHLYAEACKRRESQIVQVILTESKEGEYWGWIDTDRPDRIAMIWPRKTLFDMCFAYGPEVEEKRGKGRVVRVDIQEVDNV